ncbi:MAG: Holliday junction branch migration protein RuvA [Candidatus Omnitrophota bacterium]
MISRINGKLIRRGESSLLIEVNGFGYEVLIPAGVMKCISQDMESISLVTYHYHQADPSKSVPVLIGFLNEVEKEFFEKFITVSGIGPKAAVKAISEPIADLARAIDEADIKFLQSLPGIGQQRAREIVAKLQGKVGKFALMKCEVKSGTAVKSAKSAIEEEAVSVLLQLQYKRPEAELMIRKARERAPEVETVEGLLNEVYRQKSKQAK